MNTIPAFIAARLNHGIRCGLISSASSAHEVYNVIGHRQYVLAALKMIRA
jgi:hypothetical protein